MTVIAQDPIVLPDLDDTDPDGEDVLHMFRFPEGSARLRMAYAIEHAQELTALCGRRRVPTRTSDDLPVCPECLAVWTAYAEVA